MRPSTHVALFAGDFPCDQHGKPIEAIRHGEGPQSIGDTQKPWFSFSNKPSNGYVDFYEKMTRYAAIISDPVAVIDPKATPRTYPALPADECDSVFKYLDTASSREGISGITQRLALRKVGVSASVFGGTGSLCARPGAKTPVEEIRHLFDRDAFLNHNAFRFPGAASVEDLERRTSKVAYLAETYSKMRRGIYPHECYVTSENAAHLEGMDFVFVCIHRGEPKRELFEWLLEHGVPFIDVGMGVTLVDERLRGTLRTTTVTPEVNDHVEKRVSFVDDNEDAAYDQNIQIADLNMLNAAFVVPQVEEALWFFYHDTTRDTDLSFGIDGHLIWNEDKPRDQHAFVVELPPTAGGGEAVRLYGVRERRPPLRLWLKGGGDAAPQGCLAALVRRR